MRNIIGIITRYPHSGPYLAIAVYLIAVRELLTLAALGIALFSIDDLFIDAPYITRRLWRRFTVYTQHPRATAEMLARPDPGWMAIIVPA